MAQRDVSNQNRAQFGRIISMLLNRALLYGVSHPYVIQSLNECHLSIERLLKTSSPVVLAMNREQLFIDQVPVDPRLNVTKILAHLKKAKIESLSFYEGVSKEEIGAFLEVFASPHAYPKEEALKRALADRGVRNLKINHVVLRMVAADEERSSRVKLTDMTPEVTDEAQGRSKKLLVDMVIEGVLAEGVKESLNIQNLLKDPGGLSAQMIQADSNFGKDSGADQQQRGSLLLHELEHMGQEVKKRLSGEAKADLLELASAVFEMKRCLIEALEAQKTSEITYINEKEIVDSAHEISDTVLIGLLKEEYADGTTAVPRLAGIVRRLIPEGNELTRLLPKIKAALLEAGMPLSEYLDLTRELQSEFHGDELARVLQESSEQAGIDGSELIGEVKTNPVAAAELICLAAEIRKTTGDEKALAELLVDYVERLGPKLALDMTPVNGAAGEKHLRQVITGLESSILNRLRERDVDDHLLERLEQRLAQRMDSILEKFASEWQLTRQGPRQEDNPANLSVLEIMEQSVGEGGELGAILKTIRSKVQSGAIDENDFKQIYAEINNEKREKRPREAKKEPPSRVLKPSVLMHFVEKEVARARRYGVPFSAVALSLVKAKAQGRSASMKLSPQALMDSVSSRLSTVLREADIIGQMGKNKLVIILPMTVEAGAKPTLRRSLKALHAEPIKVNGFSVTITMTGVAIGFDPERKPTVTTFMQALSDELKDMVFRVQYIGELL